jgi:hypothetical protein
VRRSGGSATRGGTNRRCGERKRGCWPSPTVDEARRRLGAVLAKFEEAAHTCAGSGGKVSTGIFGSVTSADYATFSALHTRHHIKQIPAVLYR